jgi:hypothetical protein
MKKFIIKTILFTLSPVLLYVGAFSFLKHQFRTRVEKSSIIILGDSHTEFIDLPNSYNRSKGGSPYFVHYFFCLDFIEQLKGKKIYIAYSFHNLSKLYQNRLANDSLFPNYKNNTLTMIDEFNLFNLPHNEIATNSNYTLFNIKKIKTLYNVTFSNNRKMQSSKSICDKHKFTIPTVTTRHYTNQNYILKDKIQHQYLHSMIELLNRNNCEVILLLTPLTTDYKKRIPTDIKKEYREFAHKNGVKVLDLDSILSISDKCEYFKNYDHLNEYGNGLIEKYILTLK